MGNSTRQNLSPKQLKKKGGGDEKGALQINIDQKELTITNEPSLHPDKETNETQNTIK